MSGVVTRFVARWTPLFLVAFATFVMVNGVVYTSNWIEQFWYAAWLLVASTVLVQLDRYLELRA